MHPLAMSQPEFNHKPHLLRQQVQLTFTQVVNASLDFSLTFCLSLFGVLKTVPSCIYHSLPKYMYPYTTVRSIVTQYTSFSIAMSSIPVLQTLSEFAHRLSLHFKCLSFQTSPYISTFSHSSILPLSSSPLGPPSTLPQGFSAATHQYPSATAPTQSSTSNRQALQSDWPAQQQQTTLLDLSDDILVQILERLLNPVTVNRKRRITLSSIQDGLPLASTSARLFKLFTSFLTDIDISDTSSSTVSSTIRSGKYLPSLVTVTRWAGIQAQRLYLRRFKGPSQDLMSIPLHCTALRTVDLSFNSSVDDSLLTSIATKIPTLTNILLRKCRRVTDTGVIMLARHCTQLMSLDLSAISLLTDHAVIQIAHLRQRTLRILILSHCPQLTDSCALPLSKLSLSALFFRGSCISDSAVRTLVSNSLCGKSLHCIDLLDCPRITSTSFNVIWTHCANIRSRLHCQSDIVRRSTFQSAIRLLDDYIRIVFATDVDTGRSMTYVGVCDAGTVNAVESAIMGHGSLAVDTEEFRILHEFVGHVELADVRRMIREQFGVVV